LCVVGSARAVLTGERVALNFAQRLSGIATLTRQFVDATVGTQARIADTRKTTPGLRVLEKYAVRCGAGSNHRFALDDMILIKDNHIALCGGIAQAVERARKNIGHSVKIEVECDTLEQGA
jgi:nicotinate-nucleotide pyrophosphorylase (carboxylating)